MLWGLGRLLNTKLEQSETTLSNYRDPEFHERQNAAAEARKAMLEKFRTKPGPDDPEFQKRQAERAAIEAARAVLVAADEADRQAALEADQKAKRDARYAARKAAKKRRRRGL